MTDLLGKCFHLFMYLFIYWLLWWSCGRWLREGFPQKQTRNPILHTHRSVSKLSFWLPRRLDYSQRDRIIVGGRFLHCVIKFDVLDKRLSHTLVSALSPHLSLLKWSWIYIFILVYFISVVQRRQPESGHSQGYVFINNSGWLITCPLPLFDSADRRACDCVCILLSCSSLFPVFFFITKLICPQRVARPAGHR